MILTEYLLLILAGIVSVLAGIWDWKRGIVPNRLLLCAGLPCLMLNGLYYGFFCWELLGLFLINWISVTLLSILFYRLGVWGGGDCKLMILLAFTIPAGRYYALSDEVFPLLTVFVMIFSVGYLYLLLQSLIFAVVKTESFFQRIRKNSIIRFAKDYITASIYLTFLISLFHRVFPDFYTANPVLFLFINMCAVMVVCGNAVFRHRWLLILCAVADIILMISSRSVPGWGQLLVYGMVAVLFLIRALVSGYNYQTISIEELKPGMILSAASVMQMLSSRIPELPTGITEDMTCRLTEAEYQAVLKFHSRKNCPKEITIVRKIPFAAMIATGFALFVLLGWIT